MNEKIQQLISTIQVDLIEDKRKEILDSLVDYIRIKIDQKQDVRLIFICTHNSRRSHLSQIWAQTMAHFFSIKNVYCYSGGTESTAIFPQVIKTLLFQGFEVLKLSEEKNPLYALKFDENAEPVIFFSKIFQHSFNPQSGFAAIMTCDSADENCPLVAGSEKRIPIKYEDPKIFDGTDKMKQKYDERSLQIATEMKYVFSKIKTN